MLWYVGRRLLQMIPVFLGATLLIYFLIWKVTGGSVQAMAGERTLTPALEAQLKAQWHLDQPFFVQYWYYLKGIFTLDFGTSFSGRPVSAELARAFPITFKLAILAVIFEAVLGIGFGVITGMRRGGWFDSTMLVVSLIIIAVPVFVLGFLAQFFLGVKWGIAPVTVNPKSGLASYIVPAIVLGSLSFAYVLRLTRNSVAEKRAPTTCAPRPRRACRADGW